MSRQLVRALLVPIAVIATFWISFLALIVALALSVGLLAGFGLVTSRGGAEQIGVVLGGVALATAFIMSLRAAQAVARDGAGSDLANQLNYIGLTRLDNKLVLISAVTLMSGFTLAAYARNLVGDVAFNETQSGLLEQNERISGAVHFLHFALLAPVVEEIVFRGYLQRRLSELIGNFSAFAVVALYFVAMHLLFVRPEPLGVLGLGLLALMLGAFRIRNTPLLPAIALHVGFNLPMASAILFHTQS